MATTTVGSPSGISIESTDGGQNMHGIQNFQKHPALQLPNVGSASFDRVIEVEGFCAIELFCGCMAVTMNLMFLKVPTCCPWDVKYGEEFDILKHGQQLLLTFVLGIIWLSFFGTPCTSLSFARSPALRDWMYPEGRPGLTASQMEKVRTGNALVAWTAKAINILIGVQCYFVLENPSPGWMWVQPVIKKIWSSPTVILTEIMFQQFGAVYIKSTGLLSNMPYMWWLSSEADMKAPRVNLRGTMIFEGEETFFTKVAEPYLPMFAQMVAWVCQASLQARKLAVQSGANIPFADKKHDAATHRGENPWATGRTGDAGICWDDAADIKNIFRKNGGGAPKGLTQEEHTQWGLIQEHPLNKQDGMLSDEVKQALKDECGNPVEELDNMRLDKLEDIFKTAMTLEPARKKWVMDAPSLIKPLATMIHGPMIKMVAE